MNENDYTIDQHDDSDLVRQLRKVARDGAKRIAELETKVGAFEAKERSSSVADILKSKGYDPGVARDLGDVEPTEDAVMAWLGERPWIKPAGDAPEEPAKAPEEPSQVSVLTDEARAAFEAAQRAETGGGPVPFLGADKIRATLNEATGKGSDAMFEALRKAGLVGM